MNACYNILFAHLKCIIQQVSITLAQLTERSIKSESARIKSESARQEYSRNSDTLNQNVSYFENWKIIVVVLSDQCIRNVFKNSHMYAIHIKLYKTH